MNGLQLSDEWRTGTGKTVLFKDVLEIIRKHSLDDGQVSVGTDSFIRKNECIFSTAICLYGATNQVGGRYFIRKHKLKSSTYKTLLQRILAEVQSSVELGTSLLEINPSLSIELHLDISDPSKNRATSKFADMLVGYAKGAGFDYKIKPYAFAAASVADKHSKNMVADA
jgi:predicted RNase H-related nuclease YkuK (DUF458 family)